MAKKLSYKEKESIAYELFMDTDKSGKEIAGIVGITEKTFSKWKNDGNWELHKQASSITAGAIITNLYEKAYNLSLEEKVNADQLIKLATTIEKLSNKKVTVSQTINVFKDFIKWALPESPEIAKEINQLMRKYVDYKVNV